MKKLIFIFFWTIVCYGAGFAKESLSAKKLQEQLAVSGQDTTRLNILFQLINSTSEDPKEQISYIDQLLKAAEIQKNNYYKCQAYLYYMFQAYNRYDGEEVNKWMKLLEPLARKEKLYDLLFRGKQCVTDMLLVNEQYELEEKEATLMLKEAIQLDNIIGQISAYHSLAYVYMRTYRAEKGFEALEKAVLLGPECSNQLLYCQVLRTITMSCESRRDLPNWFKYLKESDHVITKLEKEFPLESFDGDRLLNNVSYLNYYIQCEAWEKAAQYMKQIEQDYSDQYGTPYKYHYHLARRHYYEITKNWDKALHEVELLLDLLKSISQVDYINELFEKAIILNELNRDQEAITIFKRVKLSKDSLTINTINKQAEQLKNSYKTDLQTLSKANQQQQIKQVSLGLALLIILILIVYIIHANLVKRKLTKAEQEMKEMVNETEQANKIKERFLANINMTIHPLLDIIISNSSMLASENKIDAAEKENLSNLISTTSSQLMELINEILVLSKLEAKMMKFNIKEFDTVPFIRTIVEIINQKEPGKVEVHIPHEYEINLNADQNYLKQVIDSLCHKPLNMDKNILLTLEKTEDEKLKITFENTALTDAEPSQEIIIKNEINRMIVESFGGKYIRTSQTDNSYITLILNIKPQF